MQSILPDGRTAFFLYREVSIGEQQSHLVLVDGIDSMLQQATVKIDAEFSKFSQASKISLLFENGYGIC